MIIYIYDDINYIQPPTLEDDARFCLSQQQTPPVNICIPIVDDLYVEPRYGVAESGRFTIVNLSYDVPRPFVLSDEEAIQQAVVVALDETAIISLDNAKYKPCGVSLWFIGYDGSSTPVTNSTGESSYTFLFTTGDTKPNIRDFQLDEVVPGTTPTLYLDDDFSISFQKTLIIFEGLVYNDDEALAQNFWLDQEEFWTEIVELIIWSDKKYTDDEIVSFSVVSFNLDQDDFTVLATESISWSDKKYTDDEVLPITPSDDGGFIFLILQYSWNLIPLPEDEVLSVTTTQVVDDEQPYVELVETITWSDKKYTDDEISTNLAFFYSEQEEPRVLLTEVITWGDKRYTDDEAIAPNFWLDQEEFWTELVEVVTWSDKKFIEDDISTNLAFFYREQEEPRVIVTEYIAWTPFPFRDDEAKGTPPTQAVDDEQPYIEMVETITWSDKKYTDDEIGAQLKYFYLEQEEPRTLVTEIITWTPFIIRDDEFSTNLAQFFREQEEPRVLLVESIPWSDKKYTDDEILASFWKEQEEPRVLLVESIPWSDKKYTDDDVLAQNFYIEQEEPRLLLVESIQWTPFPFRDDEILASFWKEQEEPRVLLVESIPWSDKKYTDDETYAWFGLEDELDFKVKQSLVYSSLYFDCIQIEDRIEPPPPFGLEDDGVVVYVEPKLTWDTTRGVYDRGFDEQMPGVFIHVGGPISVTMVGIQSITGLSEVESISLETIQSVQFDPWEFNQQ